jgi:serine/threonine-protein kinase
MDEEAQFDELMDRWEQAHEQGLPLSPEELCHECPHLIDRVRKRLDALKWISLFEASEDEGAVAGVGPCARAVLQEDLPETLGRFKLEEKLGSGGYGQVWRAFDPQLERHVAIKVLWRDRVSSDEAMDRVLAEARKAATLRHQHIVPVHDVGQQGPYCFIVADLIDGRSLAQRISEGRLPFEVSAEIVRQIAEALHHAHLHDLIHRDVKPGNILIDEQGKVFLTDFGIAATERELLHDQGTVSGTLRYMSPEQLQGENLRLNGRSDIYSLGVVFYELLT